MHKSARVSQNCGDRSNVSDAASTYPDVMATFLRRKYAPLRNARKLLAREAKTSPRTTEHWLAGKHPPKVEELIRLMAECDDLHNEILLLVQQQKARKEPP
jgi:hypothetical protein